MEGRALDWMISGTAQKADANAFIAWLFKDDAAGNHYAMARRMGIMYIVWNNKMFRLYDTAQGWTEYQGCLSLTSSSYDTDLSPQPRPLLLHLGRGRGPDVVLERDRGHCTELPLGARPSVRHPRCRPPARSSSPCPRPVCSTPPPGWA